MRFDAEVSAAVSAARRVYGISVDPALVHAVIQKETGHTAPAAGTPEPGGRFSYGPMQVLDSTARLHGIEDPATLLVPSLGIRIGTYELARLLKKFGGSVARALAGYNAGPGYGDAVLAFWRKYRGQLGGALAGSAAGLVGGGLALLLVTALMTARRRRRAA